MVNYVAIADKVLALIDRNGVNVSVVTKTQGTYDPATDTFSGQSETDTTAKTLFVDYNERSIDGDLVKKGDKLLLIAADALSAAPTPADAIDYNSLRYSIVNVEEINPAGTAILYKLQVRR